MTTFKPAYHETHKNLVAQSRRHLEGADIPTLCAAYDGYARAADVFQALGNEPRCVDMSFPETWRDALLGLAGDVAERLEWVCPETVEHASRRADVLISYEQACEGPSIAVAALAAQLAQGMATLRIRELADAS
jgi:hypothetical protein